MLMTLKSFTLQMSSPKLKKQSAMINVVYIIIYMVYMVCVKRYEEEQFKTSGDGVGKKQRTDQPVLKCG